MLKKLASKASLGLWSMGLLIALVVFSADQLSADIAWSYFWYSDVYLFAPIGVGIALWIVSLGFTDIPRRWLLENIETTASALTCAVASPYIIGGIIGAVAGLSPLGWTLMWTLGTLLATIALSLVASLKWGITKAELVATTLIALTGTCLVNALIGSACSTALILALVTCCCLFSYLGDLIIESRTLEITKWRQPLRTRDGAWSTSTASWVILIAAAALLALDLGITIACVAPWLMIVALYLYDGTEDDKFIIFVPFSLAFLLLANGDFIPWHYGCLAGAGLILMLVCSEGGPMLIGAAVGCLFIGATASQLQMPFFEGAVYDFAVIAAGIALLYATIKACYSRPDAMLIGTYRIPVLGIFLEEDDEEYYFEGFEDTLEFDMSKAPEVTFDSDAPDKGETPETTEDPTPSNAANAGETPVTTAADDTANPDTDPAGDPAPNPTKPESEAR